MEPFSWEERDGARWIVVEGSLDHGEARALEERFQETVLGGDTDVILVMQGVTFLGSLAVGMMLEARAALEKQGRTLKISAPSEAVNKAFALMKLEDVFEEV